jgi:hypothetical protein
MGVLFFVVGKTIDLSMPEMGVNGPAKVLAIMPTKADSRKNTDPRYKPVTGKFVHDNAEVINLYFTHQETEPLGVSRLCVQVIVFSSTKVTKMKLPVFLKTLPFVCHVVPVILLWFYL